MKISIREALFGGEELDAWEPPKSEWIILRDFSDTAWRPGLSSFIDSSQSQYDSVDFTKFSDFEIENFWWVWPGSGLYKAEGLITRGNTESFVAVNENIKTALFIEHRFENKINPEKIFK